MEKLEIVYKLQGAIEQLYHETNLFEINIKEILASITAKRLVDDPVLEKACKQLETIRELEGRCREDYHKLEVAGEIPEYIEQMRIALIVTERLLKERENYFLAKEEFLHLYSEYKEVEKPLLLCQKELATYRIEAMTEEEVKCHLEKYVLFIKAWREKEAMQLIDYTQKLLEGFSKELVAAALFQKDKLILKSTKEEEKKEKEKIKEIKLKEKEALVETEKSKEEILSRQEEKQKTFTQKVEQKQSEGKIEYKLESPKNPLENKSEYNYLVKVESCIKKEKKKFGVKSFRSDLSGVTEGLRKRILRGIREYGGVTIEFLSAITRKTKEEIKQECEILFHNGYLRLYQIEGMGELYSVSPKGRKAFEVWDAISFLHINIKGRLPKWQSLEEAEDMGCEVATKLMFFKALTSEYKKRAFPDIQIEYQIEQDVFFLRCKEFDQIDWRYYTGASKWVENETNYIQWLKAFIEEKEEDCQSKEDKKIAIKWIVLGDAVCGKRLKEFILKAYKTEIDPQSILLRTYEEELSFECKEMQVKEEVVFAEK